MKTEKKIDTVGNKFLVVRPRVTGKSTTYDSVAVPGPFFHGGTRRPRIIDVYPQVREILKRENEK